MQYKVYALAPKSDPENIRYVGQTIQTLRRRLIDHKTGKTGPYTNNWVQSVLSAGDDVIIIELERHQEHLPEREKYWIKKYKNLGYRLTNLTEGGEGVVGKKIYKPKRREPTPFMTATPEQRAEWMKTSSETKRKNRHRKNLKKVYLIDEKGNILDEFRNTYEAAEKTKIDYHSISSVCNRRKRGTDNTLFGLRFTYDPNLQFIDKYEQQKRYSKKKEVLCVNIETDNITKYESITKACENIGIHRDSVTNSLKHSRWIGGKWKFFLSSTPIENIEKEIKARKTTQNKPKK